MKSSTCVLLALSLVGGSVALDRVTSTVAGVAEYTGQPVDVYGPLPTLIYNCNNMPSICKNVQEYLDDNGLQMGGGLDFHYDSDGSSTKKRRRQSCPGSSAWTNSLPFPCGSDPAQPNVMPGNLPARVGPLATWLNPEFEMEIPNLLGTGPSGMRYTCDEFPAASWIEGGVNGLQPYTSIYCAPKAVSCDSNVWANVLQGNPNYPNTQSEQDWQGRAHALLGNYAKARSSWQNPVMKFHFTTTALAAGSAATAAQIVMPAYPGKPAQTASSNTKRDSMKKVDGGFHCTGKFCEELKGAGFAIDAPPPSASFELHRGTGDVTHADSPHATLHILTV
ncbi:hypothetical protein PDE_02220 [Penicillium oxalicum 114-2]|uniref:Uncharacterized protein n=1 Tax=Penicillium oxalicum (strain 114-2 / CGMCC 5302) TaxID=933388 RepID=S8AZ57_PENO1|nr:hypothetical protein PDE_02220 [Penicillium oxalicum 114-2]